MNFDMTMNKVGIHSLSTIYKPDFTLAELDH